MSHKSLVIDGRLNGAERQYGRAIIISGLRADNPHKHLLLLCSLLAMINYLIEPVGDSYKLTVWEPAPLSATRINPFFFKANYIISSPLEAFDILKLLQGGTGAVRSVVPGQLAKALMNYQKASETTRQATAA